MYCQNCGLKIEDNSRFCSSCGKPLNNKTQDNNRKNLIPDSSKNSMHDERQMHEQKYIKQTAKKPTNYRGRFSIGKSIFFWILWTLFLLLCLGMLINKFSILQAGIYMILLCTLILFRKRFFGKLLSSVLIWLGVFLIFFTVVGLSEGDTQRDKEIDLIQSAFEVKDVNKIADYLHPESSNYLQAIFRKHEADLDKVAELIESRKLIHADDHYAEYEVKDGNKKYVMIFEKVDGKWVLSRF